MAASIPGCVLCLFVAAAPAAAQSLGQVASDEAARRKAIRQPARVITEDDLAQATTPRTSRAPASSDPVDDDTRAARISVAPAKLERGNVPQIPIQAVSGGEVVLEVAVSREGRVTGVKVLRHTAPFTEAVSAAVRGWTFTPAEDAPAPAAGLGPDPTKTRPMSSTVLVVALFRPPALFAPTLGEPPTNASAPSGAAPVPMVPLEMPVYPANALHDGVVLLELDVASHGGVQGIGVVRSSAAFDRAAVAAASSLTFSPARVHGRPAAARVYVVAGFRQPRT